MKNFTRCLLLASLLLIISCNNSTKQKDTTNASTLKSEKLHPLRKGFSIFSLGSHIKDYSKSVKLVKEKHHTQYYEVVDINLLNISKDIKADAIKLKVWDGYISDIDIDLSEPYKEKFLDLLIDVYGMKNNKPDDIFYVWRFKEPKLLAIYEVDKDNPKKASAIFIRPINTPTPSKELIYKAMKNIKDI